MKNKTKYLSLLTLYTLTLSPAPVIAEPPIPPKRPDVMSVSPAYIDYLNNRESGEHTSYEDGDITEEPTLEKTGTVEKQKKSLKEINTNDILAVIENTIKTIPVPKRKPVITASAESLNNIETAAGLEPETTLVSFALNPGEIHINKNIEEFLKNHALKLFNDNNDLIMNIHAYATSADDANNGDVRLSLARALEVRSFLINHNINPSRLKLSPMGTDEQNTSDDRIDLIFISP